MRDENQKMTHAVFVSRRPIRRSTVAPLTSTKSKDPSVSLKVEENARGEIGMESRKMRSKTTCSNSRLYLPESVLRSHLVDQRQDRWGVASAQDCLARVPWSTLAPFGAAMISAIMVDSLAELAAVAVALFYFLGCG